MIEKAFAIEAEPGEIWTALWQDMQNADVGKAELQQSHRPHLLSLKVKLGTIPALLTYKITQREQDSEVAVTLEPLSARYGLYQILTFGHLRKNYEMLLVQGLANLKSSLEGGTTEDADNDTVEDQ